MYTVQCTVYTHTTLYCNILIRWSDNWTHSQVLYQMYIDIPNICVNTIFILHCILHSVHYILYSVHCTVYMVRRIQYIVFKDGVHCMVYKILHSNILCTIVQYPVLIGTVYSVHCRIKEGYIMYSIQCTVQILTLYTVN